ncbi:hypothetical protein B7463_g12682, partial [Scytalidium lignicola]
MANNVVVSGLTVRNTVSVQQLALMPAVRVPVLRAGRTVTAGRIQNDEAQIGQMRGTENLGAAACRHCQNGYGPWIACVTVNGLFGGSCCNCHYNSSGARCSIRQLLTNVQAAQTATTVPALTISGIAPLNNFGNTMAAPAPAPTAAHGPGGPRRVAPTWIGPVGSFHASGVAHIIPAPGATPAPVPTPPAPAPNPPVLTAKPRAARVKKLGKDFQGMVTQALKLTGKQRHARRVRLQMELTALEAASDIDNK